MQALMRGGAGPEGLPTTQILNGADAYRRRQLL